VKRDPAVSTDASGLLKVSTKQSKASCEANSELKLSAAWQRRNLAMDLAGLATFDVVESWVQFLFQQLLKEQPRGFSKISLQQILDCDRNLFVLAAHQSMGNLSSNPGEDKPLDEIIDRLKSSNEVLQYLTPLPTVRSHEPLLQPSNRPTKVPSTDKGSKGSGKGQNKGATSPSKLQLPEGCVSHDAENKPLCFAYQSGKCRFKGPAGKRCARGYHKCYKSGCFRHKPFYLCNHSD
jgi:hypothetical protein